MIMLLFSGTALAILISIDTVFPKEMAWNRGSPTRARIKTRPNIHFYKSNKKTKSDMQHLTGSDINYTIRYSQFTCTPTDTNRHRVTYNFHIHAPRSPRETSALSLTDRGWLLLETKRDISTKAWLFDSEDDREAIGSQEKLWNDSY